MAGLRIIAQERVRWSNTRAKAFYPEHKDRSFYRELCNFMTSGPIVVQILGGNNAIAKYRKVMGTTDPTAAEVGSIRKFFAGSMQQNSVHGSDSPASAEREIALTFRRKEIVG